uniref:Uncharacterized protein n=1 Tax=Sciurus vulgaris TaxID=55149 RepID=A0A8D2DFA2_SCIVU
MSDAEENSSSESMCSGRKLPHRNASAVARKKLLHNSDDDQSLKSEIEEEELKDQGQSLPASSSHAAKNTVNDSENGDSESESDLRVARKNWHTNGYKSHIPGTSKTKFLKIESSEEDSKSHDSDDGHRTAGPSISGQKLQAESISEEADSEPGNNAFRKNANFFKKAKILSDSEDSESEEKDREDGRCHKMEMSPVSGNLKCESLAVPQCLSDHVSETDLDSDDDQTEGKPNTVTNDSAPQDNGQSRKVSRKRVCSSDSENNSKVIKKSSKARTGSLRITRSSVSTAASMVRLRSDAEDVRSGSVCTRSKRGRKQPPRPACTTARKVPSDCEEEVHCEVPNEQYACGSEPPEPDTEGSAGSCSQSLNGDSDSEGIWNSEHSRHINNHNTSVPSKTKNSSVGEISRNFSSESTFVQKMTTENNFEEELNYGLRRWNGRRLRTYGKAPFSKTKVIHDSQATTETEIKRKRLHPESENVKTAEATGSTKCGPDTSPKSSDLGSVTESDVDCTGDTKTKRRKTKGKAKVVRKGKAFTTNVSKTVRRQRQSKRPRLNVDDNDWEDLDYAKSKRVLRRSKIKTRNQGRRTVRYHDGDDDKSLENVLEFNDRTL